MKNGIYKVKPWGEMDEITFRQWYMTMETNCPKSRQIRVFNDRWNISGEEFPVCPEMFEDGQL